MEWVSKTKGVCFAKEMCSWSPYCHSLNKSVNNLYEKGIFKSPWVCKYGAMSSKTRSFRNVRFIKKNARTRC